MTARILSFVIAASACVLASFGCSRGAPEGASVSAFSSPLLAELPAQAPTARHRHSSTLLPTGEILVAGGRTNGSAGTVSNTSDLFNVRTGTWRTGPGLASPRTDHSAVLLRNGKVLIAGGFNGGSLVGGAELYDPKTNTLSSGGTLVTPSAFPMTSLLRTGEVLYAGGWNISNFFADAELYDPASNTWTAVAPMGTQRALGAMVLLSNGEVLVVGGSNASGSLSSCEIFSPTTRTFRATSPMNVRRYEATVTLLADGRVLATGGEAGSSAPNVTETAEIFDPDTGTWRLVGPMSTPRALHTATLLPGGLVFVAGGYGQTGIFSNSLTSTELFDPVSEQFTSQGTLATGRQMQTATTMPSGEVVLIGGMSNGQAQTNKVEVFDDRSPGLSASTSLPEARGYAALTPLSDGRALLSGGKGTSGELSSALLFDPATGWTTAGSMAFPRSHHTGTLLSSGEVIAIGGRSSGQPRSEIERYSASTNAWTSAAASLATPRADHTSTLLGNGRILIVGGTSATAQCEQYDPLSDSVLPGPILNQARLTGHTATLLANGKVLIVGGENSSGPTKTAELIDVNATAVTQVAPMNYARSHHSATLLVDGRVLVTGGGAQPEIFDPATGTWTITAAPALQRQDHAAVLLTTGELAVLGGFVAAGTTSGLVEVFNPARRSWTAIGTGAARAGAAVALLSTNEVLIAGGVDGSGAPVDAVELLSDGRRSRSSEAPSLNALGSMSGGQAVTLSGARFTGVSEGSFGYHASSPANLPLFTFTRLEGGVVRTVPATSWNASSAQVTLPLPLSAGWYAARVTVNGITSEGVPVLIGHGPGDLCVDASECSTGFCVDGVCCNSACAGGPCEACSAARGAQVDGVCSLLPATATCRARASTCDAEERCTGVSASCPTDLSLPDGTVCDGGVCVGGACTEVLDLDAGQPTPDAGGPAQADAGDDQRPPEDAHAHPRCGCHTTGAEAFSILALLALTVRVRRRAQ